MSDPASAQIDIDQFVRDGISALQDGRFADAVVIFELLSQVNAIRDDALFNLGIALTGQALDLARNGRLQEALALCQRALDLDPENIDAMNTQGFIYMGLGQYGPASAAYWRAVSARPENAELWNSLGTALYREAQLDEAELAYGRAAALAPGFAGAVTSHAFTLALLARHQDAADAFERALELTPSSPRLLGGLLASRACIADWQDRDALLSVVADSVDRGEAVIDPLTCLALYDDPALHRRCAESAVAAMRPDGAAGRSASAQGEKIRLGYLSSDLYEHAIAYLMAEVFERHDRSRFEVVAFHTGPHTDDPMQTRLRPVFESFYDAEALSDEDLAKAIAAEKIEILVDLSGFTAKGRTAALATRPARVQVNFLGFPGTLAADFVDYIIGDPTVTPAGCDALYTEKIVRLPTTYQPNAKRPAAGAALRAEHGLPQTGVVFCSFNNPYKITPQVFSSWMRILHATPGSVLWLLDLNPGAAENLRRETATRGMDPARLIFAAPVSQAEHLARLALADIALDTAPYTSHTTASDALWAGVPLITSAGQSFASRVAASLVSAAGVPELARPTPQDAEAFAIALARDGDQRADLQRRLIEARETSPLFNAAAFTRDLEAAFQGMSAKSRAGLAVEGFDIPRAAG